uniref:Glutaredoxin domain-containing protein n=1 Tax=Phlebotomus papatasi TaxID=29031 RepID=A0A1B0DQH4_PHLPP
MGIFSSKEPVDMSGPVAQFVRETIASDKVVIFSKTYCPYCSMAKEVSVFGVFLGFPDHKFYWKFFQQFRKLSQDFTAIELESREDGSEIQDVLGEITGARTVPRVFVKGEFIGGGTDVKKLYNDGSLKKMLE